MKLMIDTNIILDVLLAREPYLQDSLLIWKLCETGQAEGHMSALSFTNLVYVMRRELSPGQIEEVLGKLRLIFRIADLCENDLVRAAALQWQDFEDALQAVTASRIRADHIVSRNTRDFSDSPVPVISPAELIASFH